MGRELRERGPIVRWLAFEAAAGECYRIVKGEFDRFFRA
jgi:hypothetical protein